MFKKSLLTLLATLSLGGALTAQTVAPTTPIKALPFTISAPGTYVLKSNLTYAGGGNNLPQAAITINAATGGNVILELKGFTITSAVPIDPNNPGSNFTTGISIQSFPGGTPPVVTIRNGTVTNFGTGIAVYQTSGLTINRLTFNQNNQAVSLQGAADTSITNCQFNGVSAQNNGYATGGIFDENSPGGNAYHNNTFTNIGTTLQIGSFPNPSNTTNTVLVLDGCRFAPAPTN